MENRRQSKINQALLRAVIKLWQLRLVILLTASYLLVFGWLFSGELDSNIRPAEALAIPDDPVWKKPDREHWFGTTGTGADLFQMSRVAMAKTAAIAVVASGSGVALAFLVVMLFAFDPGKRRFSLLKSCGRVGYLVPGMLVLVIVAGGTGGGLLSIVLAVISLIALHLAPILASWIEEGENRPDFLTGYTLGLTRVEMVKNRIFPQVQRRLIGVFAGWIPVVVLVEMALSFLGFAGDQHNCGAMISFGQSVIIEAPWMAVCPGILASAVVMMLALLGWLSSVALKTGNLPRPF